MSVMPNGRSVDPPHQIFPASRLERISGIDTCRGLAVLGMELVTVGDIGFIHSYDEMPRVDTLYGPHGSLNFAILLFTYLFFSYKVRGIFSMLFGASVILMTERSQSRGASGISADLYARRNMFLALVGFLQSVFIFPYELLFQYGLAALLFLYPARRFTGRALIILGVLTGLTLAEYSLLEFTQASAHISLSSQVAQVQRKLRHEPLTADDLAAESQWQALQTKHNFEKHYARQIAGSRVDYRTQVESNFRYFFAGPNEQVYLLPETVSAMLLGMGLYKIGFLTAALEDSVYLATVVFGFGISWSLYIIAFVKLYQSGFNFLVNDRWVFLPFELTRLAGMLALTAVIMLLVKHSMFIRLQRWLAAVGRTALSSYVATNALCQLVFIWEPWQLFGKLAYYDLLFIVPSFWILNLLVSNVWLKNFKYGPLEWASRSLTYGEVLPFRTSSANENG